MLSIDSITLKIHPIIEILKKKCPSIIYHYCSNAAFLSIIQNKTIRMSPFHYMNDFMECRWLDRIIMKQIQSFPHKVVPELWSQFLQLQSLRRAYLACFSEHGDQLSQWRAYADDGKGIAIGFDTAQLGLEHRLPCTTTVTDQRTVLHNVVYEDSDNISNHIENIIGTLLDILRGTVTSEQASHMVSHCNAYISPLSTIVKNKAFHEEAEWRIISMPLELYNDKLEHVIVSVPSQINFAALGDHIRPFCTLDLSNESKSPICEIVLGSKNRTDLKDIEIFMAKQGFGRPRIRRSASSYR